MESGECGSAVVLFEDVGDDAGVRDEGLVWEADGGDRVGAGSGLGGDTE